MQHAQWHGDVRVGEIQAILSFGQIKELFKFRDRISKFESTLPQAAIPEQIVDPAEEEKEHPQRERTGR